MTDGKRKIRPVRSGLFCVLAVCALSPAAQAATLLQYEFNGQPGTETSVAAMSAVLGITGLSFTESGVSPNAGANSINAAGFNGSNPYYQFGFNLLSGYTATVNQLTLGTKSSNSGPGSISVLASSDGGAFNAVATISETGADVYQMLSLTPVTGSSSIIFRFVPTNQTAVNGGAIGSAGTFRVEDFSTNATGTPTGPAFSINGSVAAAQSVSAAPEPGVWALMLGGVGAMGAILRRRRDIAATA